MRSGFVGTMLYNLLSNIKDPPDLLCYIHNELTNDSLETDLTELKKRKDLVDFILPWLEKLSTDEAAWAKLDTPMDLKATMAGLAEAAEFLKS